MTNKLDLEYLLKNNGLYLFYSQTNVILSVANLYLMFKFVLFYLNKCIFSHLIEQYLCCGAFCYSMLNENGFSGLKKSIAY